MSIESELRRNKGVIRTARLLSLGWSTHTVEKALAAERVVRPKVGWLALPDADPELITAITRGTILTCITQARRLGLWVLNEPELHLAAPSRRAHVTSYGCTIHWGRPLIPRDPQSLEDPIANVLGFVATCQPHEAALAIWDSAFNKRLIDKPTLERLPLTKRTRNLLAASTFLADSGLETLARTRLRTLGIAVSAQALVLGHFVDFRIGRRLILQLDGAHHVGTQRSSDIRHDAELRLRGYTVLRVSYVQMIDDWQAVQDLILTAIAQGLHLDRLS